MCIRDSYKILPTVAPFAGVSKSYLTNFNSEATSQGLVAPESGLEYEAGIKLSTPDNRIILTAAAFDIQRTNVFTENTATTPITVAFNAQKSYGFDADLQMLITPQWTVLANMISQTARLTAVPLTPAQVGNWPVGVPAHIYNIWSTYDFAIAGDVYKRQAYATGPTTIPGLNYRVDGLLAHSDGFRNLESANYEVRPVLQWNKDNHVTTFALDYRHIERTPDPYGIVYFNGAALAGTPLNVPNTFKYSTPFSFGNQDFERGTLTDSWWFADYLTINNRLAYTHRCLLYTSRCV